MYTTCHQFCGFNVLLPIYRSSTDAGFKKTLFFEEKQSFILLVRLTGCQRPFCVQVLDWQLSNSWVVENLRVCSRPKLQSCIKIGWFSFPEFCFSGLPVTVWTCPNHFRCRSQQTLPMSGKGETPSFVVCQGRHFDQTAGFWMFMDTKAIKKQFNIHIYIYMQKNKSHKRIGH